MSGTRDEVLVNCGIEIGFRHFFNGILMNADQVFDVRIFDPDTFQVVHVIPAAQILNPDIGVYTAVIPANVLSKPGLWRDSWQVQSVPGATIRNFTFTINVVVIPTAQSPVSLDTITSCTVEDMDACLMKQRYLWPVWSVLSNGYYLPDDTLQYYIDTNISWMQRHLGVPLRATRVRTRPFADQDVPVNIIGPGGNPTPPSPANLQVGVDFDEEGRLIQWDQPDSQNWSTIRLPHTNIIRVLGVRGVYGGRNVYRIPNDWVDRNELKMGFVRIRPTVTGSIANIVDGSGRFLDVTLLESIGMNFVPGFWAVDYDYGFTSGQIPKEICDIVMKKAAVLLLDQLGQAITKGLSSRAASVDGLSSSIGFVANAERTLFGALARRYEEEIAAENLLDIRKYYKGPSVFIT